MQINFVSILYINSTNQFVSQHGLSLYVSLALFQTCSWLIDFFSVFGGGGRGVRGGGKLIAYWIKWNTWFDTTK